MAAPGAEAPRTEAPPWRDALEDRTGMEFRGTRARILNEALTGRAQAAGQISTDAYIRQLLLRRDSDPEWAGLNAALRNGDTRFFRNGPSFAAFTAHVLPDLLRSRGSTGCNRLSIWSAGCSTGQEPYSLAAACLVDPACAGWKIEVLGTDANRDALARATLGLYRPHETVSLPGTVARRCFERVGDSLRVGPALREMVRFRNCDLFDALPSFGWHDVIFCQNVLVYYTRVARAELLERLAAALALGGYLVLGDAEALGLPTPGLRLIRLQDTWIYQRAD